MKPRHFLQIFSFVVLPLSVFVACGSTKQRNVFEDQPDGGEVGFGEAGFEGGDPTGIGGRDPVTCAEAAQFRTYVGCDYWPTVTDNLVANVFDFAVAVANGGADDATITVTGPGGVKKKVTVAGGSLEKVYLPWVAGLKAPAESIVMESLIAQKGAYHLVADKPVVVYQFNPMEFKAVGGEPGKNWSSCQPQPPATECYSYSNDASLLLPSTAMTGSYRIMGTAGWSAHPRNPLTGQFDKSKPLEGVTPPYFAVTGTADGTKVTVKLSAKGNVVGGSDIATTAGGGTVTFTLNAGDVAEVVGKPGQDSDFSGSLLTATNPVQVITGTACIYFPLDTEACDHVEETVFPAQTMGKHYVVMHPTGPKGNDVGHVVRVFGNVDGTKLTYRPSKPSGCPATIDAGAVVDCGEVTEDFEVSGDKEFGVAMFQLGGAKADPDFDPLALVQPQGDPSQSFAVTVEQYRKRYVFLAPTDYKTSYVDVVATSGTKITLDGKDESSRLKDLSGTDFVVGRLQLGAGKDGVHVLEGSDPIGIQVIGYGDNTSYQYPGGLNLSAISAAPVK